MTADNPFPAGGVMSAEPYQFLPALAPDEYAALREDIRANGVRVPVDVDEHGVILDGHHRRRIADEFGVDCPTRTVTGLAEDNKREHALAVNLHRRQLGPVSWAAAFHALLDMRGIQLGQGSRNDRTSDTVSEVARQIGVEPRTARRRLKLAADLADHPDLAAKVDAGDMAPNKARGEVWARQRAAAPQPAALAALDPRLDIRHGDFRHVLADIAPGTVALVFTDPPYLAEHMHLYGDLGQRAAGWLQPGSRLVTYCGQTHLYEAMTLLSDYLRFQWVAAALHGGGYGRMWWPKLHCAWKPLLIYGPDSPTRFLPGDVVSDGRREKEHHPWQQAVSEARHFVEALTDPGDLVVDPFLGSGTTAVACRQLGRRFVGCDIDPVAVATARQRLTDDGGGS